MSGAAAAAAASMASSTSLPPALRMYRQLLGLARRLPPEQRTSALRQIREGFRSNAKEGEEGRVKALLDNASSTLAYLRMVTPKRPSEVVGGEEGRVRIVYKEGEVVEGGDPGRRDKAAVSNWSGSNMDPDAVAKHRSQLNRMGFRDNAHAKGFF